VIENLNDLYSNREPMDWTPATITIGDPETTKPADDTPLTN